ncbi:hypothetical protein PV326_009939, partial [Microctonus aethiopoides]
MMLAETATVHAPTCQHVRITWSLDKGTMGLQSGSRRTSHHFCSTSQTVRRSDSCLMVVEPSLQNRFNHIRCEKCKIWWKTVVQAVSSQKKIAMRIMASNKMCKKLLQGYNHKNKTLQCK